MVLLAYWLFGALKATRARLRENLALSFLRTALTVFVFLLLFHPVRPPGWQRGSFRVAKHLVPLRFGPELVRGRHTEAFPRTHP